MQTPMLTRRGALLGLSAAFSFGGVSMALGAAPTENRLVIVILRGALDGMSAVQPYGDPAFAGLRGQLALPQPGTAGGVLDLGGFYGMHPSLVKMHAMYQAGDLMVLHAVAGHYRSRSHFEAQDYLECGVEQRLASGWLNRAVATMPAVPGQEIALSMGLSTPLMLRGPARVEAWAPEHFGQGPSDDLYSRLLRVTAHDPLLGPSLTEGMKQRGISMATDGDRQNAAAQLAGVAGKMLSSATGPRVAVLELDGWDTHSAQLYRLKAVLAHLDDMMAALKTGLGDAWPRTAVLAVTEFGRTARINGTGGTDHGTGTVAFLAGGAVAGGKVKSTWPGLSPGNLFENRDLAPTADVRSICKGLLAAHLAITPAGLAAAFPSSADAPAMRGLLRV